MGCYNCASQIDVQDHVLGQRGDEPLDDPCSFSSEAHPALILTHELVYNGTNIRGTSPAHQSQLEIHLERDSILEKKFLIFSGLMNKRLRIIIRIFSGSKLNIRNSRMSRRTLQYTRRQPSRRKRLTPWACGKDVSIYNSASRANYDMRFGVTFSESLVLINVLSLVGLVIVEFELLFHSSFIHCPW